MSFAQQVSDNKADNLSDMAEQLQQFVREAARHGESLYDTEKGILATVLKMGQLAVDAFLKLQGSGDLGETIETEAGDTLTRSEEPISRPLRTVFGEHTFEAYVYSPGPKKKIALLPIDARLGLSAAKGSYLWEEFSQYFCVEQAFGQAASALERVLGPKLSVDTLERTNQRLGEQAEEFLDTLPPPPSDEEGELLVATADGKGVPLIREGVQAPPVHGPKPPRPNNRRMATLACVYSVDRHERTAEDVVAALFRDERPSAKDTPPRPRPCHKRLTACFPEVTDEGSDDELRVRGDVHAWSWAAEQIATRRRPGQVLIRLCDGQESLWEASDVCLGLDNPTETEQPSEANAEEANAGDVVDVLDIIHVCGYVWLAARAICGKDESAVERFVRNRLLRILEGQAAGVISGMRRMATERGLPGDKMKDVAKACNYLANNLHRMRYDQCLAHGYPIASGVIEGACRHLVKDRMERTGMRWRQTSAGQMLYVRAIVVTDLWEPFQSHRQSRDQATLHPHRNLLRHYAPDQTLTL